MTAFDKLLKLPHGWEDPTTWALIALAAFLGVLAYLGIPGMMARNLDQRAKSIADELEEARRLREEAQEVLAGYQRRQRAAEQEARDIVERARREADAMAAAMRQELTERLERRTAMAERKIAQAEAEAAAQVRNQAAALAAQAAQAVLADVVDAAGRDRLFDASVTEIASRLRDPVA